ncbi:hypothetical protein EP227_05515 [bacterium]|nr:MAG: hypothetical protein EP227_05515 [bacterium]
MTDNGLPSGGGCSSGGDGTGATIRDANIPAGSDAFDWAAMVWVDNTQVAGTLSQIGNTVTFGSSTISGLNIQMQYEILTTSATQRTLLSLTNPTAGPITVSVDYASNFGSDGSTTVQGTSSGDTVFNTADGWVVTSDSGDFDPVNTTVLYGAGSPSVTTSSVTQVVFNCAGPEGVGANYSVTVPAGTTRSLMFFQHMSDTTPNALTEATMFDNPTLDPDLLTGLSPVQQGQILNWALGTAPPPVTPAVIPTMNEWGMIIFMIFAGIGAIYYLRKQGMSA